MADARREHEYNVAIDTIQFFSAAFAGQWDVSTANPWREKVEKTPEQLQAEAKEGWSILEAGLRRIAQQRG